MSVLIIGGGPAGLALAHQLQQRKIEYLLLEKASHLGNTFRTMASNTTLGPWLHNVLPTTSPSWRVAWRRTEREEYAQYLSEYAIQRNLEYVCSVDVERVLYEEGRFRVLTNQGRFSPRVVVNATGYFSHPYTPEFPGAAASLIPQLHAAAYKEPDTVRRLLGRNRGRVLVVGHRTTAGETIESLYRAGFEVCLSHRSPIRYAMPGMMESLLFPLTHWLEEMLVHNMPGWPTPPSLESRMSTGPARRLIEWGLVTCFPAIERFEGDEVRFVDGRSVAFDLVIYATGYRPALKHLQHLVRLDRSTGLPALFGMESQEARGLFFLGLAGLRSFRSQFLRGIREDAVHLAGWLERYGYRPGVLAG